MGCGNAQVSQAKSIRRFLCGKSHCDRPAHCQAEDGAGQEHGEHLHPPSSTPSRGRAEGRGPSPFDGDHRGLATRSGYSVPTGSSGRSPRIIQRDDRAICRADSRANPGCGRHSHRGRPPTPAGRGRPLHVRRSIPKPALFAHLHAESNGTKDAHCDERHSQRRQIDGREQPCAHYGSRWSQGAAGGCRSSPGRHRRPFRH